MDVDLEWARCAHWIKAALGYCPTHNLDDVKAEVMAGEAVLWPGRHCVAITVDQVHPRERVCAIWLAGGDMDELVNHMHPQIEAWAKSRGFTRMLVPGRHGWARVLKPLGYEPYWTLVTKEI